MSTVRSLVAELEAGGIVCLYNEHHDEKGRFASKGDGGGNKGQGRVESDVGKALATARAQEKGASVGWDVLERALGRPPTSRERSMFRSVVRANGGKVVEAPAAPEPPAAEPSEPAQEAPAEPQATEAPPAAPEPAAANVTAPTSLPVPVVPPNPTEPRLVRDLNAREAEVFASVRASVRVGGDVTTPLADQNEWLVYLATLADERAPFLAGSCYPPGAMLDPILLELAADRLACAVPLDATVPSLDEPKWVQLAYSGTWKGHKQAKSFTFDAKSFAEMVRNFRDDPRYDGGNTDVVAFDFNHASEMHPATVADKGSPAQAWLQEVEVRQLAGGKPELWGKVRYLPLARNYVRGGQYRFLSIAFAPNDRDLETGKPCGPRIKSVAFTNDPFLRGLRPLVASAGAPIHLSRDGHEDKMLLEGLIGVLGLSSAATEDEVLGAVEKLKNSSDERDQADAQADVTRVCSAYGFDANRDGPVLLMARQSDPDAFAKRYPARATAPAAAPSGAVRSKLAPRETLTSSVTAPRKPAGQVVSLFSAEAHGAANEDEDEGGFSVPENFNLSDYPGRNATEKCMAFVDTLPQFKAASREEKFRAAVAVKRTAEQRGA